MPTRSARALFGMPGVPRQLKHDALVDLVEIAASGRTPFGRPAAVRSHS